MCCSLESHILASLWGLEHCLGCIWYHWGIGVCVCVCALSFGKLQIWSVSWDSLRDAEAPASLVSFVPAGTPWPACLLSLSDSSKIRVWCLFARPPSHRSHWHARLSSGPDVPQCLRDPAGMLTLREEAKGRILCGQHRAMEETKKSGHPGSNPCSANY